MTILRRCILVCLALQMITIPVAQVLAEPIGWIEKFALADSRSDVLQELIPGTDDYFFYHSLHFQNLGELSAAEAMLDQWLEQHSNQTTPAIQAMTDRQRLLTYDQSPQRTIDYLIKRLNVKLDHAAPPMPGNQGFPSSLDAQLLDADDLIQGDIDTGRDLTAAAVAKLGQDYRDGDPVRPNLSLGSLLDAVDSPNVFGLGELVIRELQKRSIRDRKFGNLAAHRYLTLSELQAVASRVPEVAGNESLVNAILGRLRPPADIDLADSPDARLRYLQRVEAYVRTLPPYLNSMKAAATYQLLSENLSHGIYDRELFDRYLQLPRTSPIVPIRRLEQSPHRADLNLDFSDVAILPPVGDEQPVVRAHLEHFLEDASSSDAFAPYLKPEYLQQVFAEAKLLAGVGPTDRWYKQLPNRQQRELRDRVELDLAADNPRTFAENDITSFDVTVKNIDELTIRIYQINTRTYHLDNEKPLDTNIDLDGLVATHQRTETYDQPAIRRHRETLHFPEISGRGVWVVDLIGSGIRTRALIRRGSLDYVQSTDPAGLVFTIVDEHRKPLRNTKMWLDSREFSADKNGRIVVPLSDKTRTRKAVVSDGTLATSLTFVQPSETYELSAGMHVDRTLLQSGGSTKLLIRPQLTMSGAIVDPAMLRDVAVRIESKDREGIVAPLEIDDVEMNQNGEMIVPFRVPARMAELTVRLTASVRRLADAQVQNMETSHQWTVAGVRASVQTHDAFLTRDEDDYVIELRGRNGEAVAGAILDVSIDTWYSSQPVAASLQADDVGRVRLGKLANVTTLRYSVAGGQTHVCSVDRPAAFWPDTIHATTGVPVRLASPDLTGDPAKRFRLVSVADNWVRTEHTDEMILQDGFLQVTGLVAGDYRLIDRRTGRSHLIAVVDGPIVDDVAVGSSRHRSMSPANPLSIASIRREADGLRIQLSGNTKSARVYVYAKRYLDGVGPLPSLRLQDVVLSGRRVTTPRCGYVSGLQLGDEYQYVMRRRSAEKYAGVMLPQPGLILNPWETEETSNASQSVRPDQPVPASSAPSKADMMGGRGLPTDVTSTTTGSDFDFLADPGVVLAGLVPNTDGLITIPADVIEGMPIVDIVVCDSATIVGQTVTSELTEVETIDQRLAKSLDADVPFSMRRDVLIASPDQPLDLKTLGDARIQVYGSVASLMSLYRTLVADPRFAEFDELKHWKGLERSEQQTVYSRLASHELHLFLWAHDRPFFDEVVAPYLTNKKQKQFVDQWLLGEDLSSYTQLWKYQTLNAAERAMLALRVPEVRDSIRRELREVVAGQDADYELLRRQVDTALGRSSMDVGYSDDMMDMAFGMADMDGVVREDMPMGDPFGGGEDPFSVEAEEMGMGMMLGDAPSRSAGNRKKAAREVEAEVRQDLFESMSRRRIEMLSALAFYRDIDSTRQWAESQWDRVRTVGQPNSASLIKVNRFWADLAGREDRLGGVSAGLLEPTDSRHAALVSLAFCGLPMTAGNIQLPTERDAAYRPEHTVAVVTKRLMQLKDSDNASDVMIGQRITHLDQDNASEKESSEIAEFVAGVAYRGQLVLSNPSNRQRTLDVLWQLPAGSIPLGGGQTTDSKRIELKPFAVTAVQYSFYFPNAGSFAQYPATVADGDALAVQAPVQTFVVKAQPSSPDQSNWEWIAAHGDIDQINAFLAETNLHELDWMEVAHRMRDPAVYGVVIEHLKKHRLPIEPLWAYSLKHGDKDNLQGFLSLLEDLVDRVGPVLQSPLLKVQPIERHRYEVLEYAPLVRARIHRLGQQDEILNAKFLSHYRDFLRMLAYEDQLAATTRLELTYYLLIQNRIGEAIAQFKRVERDQTDAALQYDYMSAYLAMHQGRYDDAAKITVRYADHPVERWHQRFAELRSRLTGSTVAVIASSGGGVPENEGLDPAAGDLAVMDRERQQAAAADSTPEVIASIEGDRIRIDYRQTDAATVRLYGVDLELLFSKAPFVRDDLKRMAMVKPMQTRSLEFENTEGTTYVDLEANLRRQTWLVEVVSGASRDTTLAYGGSMTTYVSEAFGQLQATDAATRQPIPKAYVKVYAKYPDGDVKFYKDGYTDVRGRFDYASLSADDAQGAVRHAILVLSDQHGATLHDVAAPK